MIPWSRSLCSSLSLSTTAALVVPLTFRRLRFPSSVYPSVTSPRQSPGQRRWRSGSRQGVPGGCPRDYVMNAQRIMPAARSGSWRAGGFLPGFQGIKLALLTSVCPVLLLLRDLCDVITWTRFGCGRRHGQAGRRQGGRAGGITDAEQRSAEGDRSGVHRWRFLRSRRSAAGEVREGAAGRGGGRAGVRGRRG